MLVVLPYCQKDRALACKLLQWMIELDGRQENHRLVLMASNPCTKSENTEVMRLGIKAFGNTVMYRQVLADERGNPFSAKTLFRHTCEIIAKEVKLPFLWLEPDATPLKKGWLDAIQTEYETRGMPFLGTLGVPEDHLNGNAVYPANAIDYRDMFVDKPIPFDCLGGKRVLQDSAITPLIQHRWSIDNQPKSKPHTFNGPSSLKVISPEAVIFHRCKDGTLIDSLRGAKQDHPEPPPKERKLTREVHVEWAKPYASPPHRWAVPVSIVLPVKNDKPEYLRECWESILSQTHHAWELVVVDDSSNRDTITELTRIACHPKVRLIKGDAKGLPAALNKAIGLANTELIARMDADDVMLPNRIELQVMEFARHSRTDLLGAQLEAFGAESGLTTKHPAVVTVKSLLRSNWQINHPTVMFRKSSWGISGGYDESLTAAEDYGMWMKMASLGMQIRNMPDTVLRYRRHKSQKGAAESCIPTTDRVAAPYRVNRIKVAFVTQVMQYGGAETWLLDLIRATSKIADWLVVGEQHIHPKYRQALSEVADVIVGNDHSKQLNECNVILFWWPKHNMATYSKRAKLVLVSHGAFNDKWASEQAKYVSGREHLSCGVGVSRWATDALVSTNVKNCITINNGLPRHHYQFPLVTRDVWRTQNEVGGIVIGYIGRMSPEKGFNELIAAAKALPSEITILAAGTHWPPETIEEYFAEVSKATNGRIKPMLWRNDIAELCAACDAMIVPSKYESFCYTLLEGWLSGIPVIATPCGIGIDHQDWCIPIKCQVDSIANTIADASYLDMKEERREQIASAAHDEYSWAKFQREWCDFLLKLTNQPKR